MKSSSFSKPSHREFAKCLEASSGGHTHTWDSFSSFLDMSYYSMSQAAYKLRTGEVSADKEKSYMEAVSRVEYPNKMAEAFAIVVNALEVERYDFIGSFAGEAELVDGQWKGQFFTPESVCTMMACMTLGDSKPDLDHRLTICEPACGGGAIAIAAAKNLQDRGFLPIHYWMDCTDIDKKMFQACYVQLSLCGVPGIVRHMNSLSMEQFEAELTTCGVLFPYRPEKPCLPKRRQVPGVKPRKRVCPS